MTSLIQTLAVAEHLSFHRAAKALGTSQSSVSARIKALEEDLGIVLFDRNTRGVRLTEPGHRFVERVHDAMGILDQAIRAAGMQSRGEEGELRIGVHALTPGCFLERLLERFHIKHPGIFMHIAEGTARDAQLMVREGRLDVAFMLGTHQIQDINSRVIWRDRLMVMLSPTHPLAAQTEVEWRHLAEEHFLVRHGGTGPQVHDLILARTAGKGLTPTIVRADVERSTLMMMIAANVGISLAAAENVPANKMKVVFLPIRDEPAPVNFSAVWLPSNRNPSLLNLLNLAGKALSV